MFRHIAQRIGSDLRHYIHLGRRRTRRLGPRRHARIVGAIVPLEERTLLSAMQFSAPVDVLGVESGLAPSSAVVTGDFNNDARTDLVVTSGIVGKIEGGPSSILSNEGGGVFSSPAGVPVPADRSTFGLAAADLDSDGDTDLAISWRSTLIKGVSGVSVLLNDGTGGFSAPLDVFSDANNLFLNHVVAADFDGDSRIDLAVESLPSSGGAVSLLVMSNRGGGAFSPPVELPTTSDGLAGLAAADLNGDGHTDLAFAGWFLDGSSGIATLLNDGTGGFSAPVRVFDAPAALNLYGLAAADLNGDGRSDLALETGMGGKFPSTTVSVLVNQGGGAFSAPSDVISLSDREPGGLAAADLDGDGLADLAFGWRDIPLRAGGVSVAYQVGPGTTPTGQDVSVQPVDPVTGTSPVAITFSTVTAGGTTTVTTSSQGPPPPEGFKLSSSPPTYYDLATTATFSGTATVAISYAGLNVHNESGLRLFHYENGVWVDRTSSVDTANDIIYATVTSFSPFALFEAIRQVQIDVKPDAVNLASNGKIAVTIFTTSDFDAAQVDVSTVVFAGAHAVSSSLQDVDGDGDLDRVLLFNTQDTDLKAIYQELLADDADADGVLDSTRQVAQVRLTGETLADESFEGYDSVTLFLSGKSLRDLLDQMHRDGLL